MARETLYKRGVGAHVERDIREERMPDRRANSRRGGLGSGDQQTGEGLDHCGREVIDLSRPVENRQELEAINSSLEIRTRRSFHGPPRGVHAATIGKGSGWGGSGGRCDGASDNGLRRGGSSGVHERIDRFWDGFTFLPKSVVEVTSRLKFDDFTGRSKGQGRPRQWFELLYGISHPPRAASRFCIG